MEAKRKKRASVFDPYSNEVIKYIEIGISLRAIHKIISAQMQTQWSYDGFYKWVIRTNIRG